MAGGRPSKYRQEFVKQAIQLSALGATDVELAQFFGVTVSTLFVWKSSFPEFSEALKTAKDIADSRVERSLYHRAIGYTHEEDKHFVINNEIKTVRTLKHYPPDSTAGIFWLKNRKSAEWRDRKPDEEPGSDVKVHGGLPDA